MGRRWNNRMTWWSRRAVGPPLWWARRRLSEESLEPLFQATIRALKFDPFPGGVYETDPAWLDGIPTDDLTFSTPQTGN